MAKHIVMLHGTNVGGWCFDRFKAVFENLGWTCYAPNLIGHGTKTADAGTKLVGIGMADYLAEVEAFLKTIAAKPVLLGHSMGAVLAQQLAAQGLARALILVSPAPRSGILPQTKSEKRLWRSKLRASQLKGPEPFWKDNLISPDFDLARSVALNCMPKGGQRAVFAKFGPESGRALFELFFWMFDPTGATVVNTNAVSCPVLCMSGSDDKLVSLATARATAQPYRGATFWELEDHGHMLMLEPGAKKIARRIATWIPA